MYCFYWGINHYWTIGEEEKDILRNAIKKWKNNIDCSPDYRFIYEKYLYYRFGEWKFMYWKKVPLKKQERILKYIAHL